MLYSEFMGSVQDGILFLLFISADRYRGFSLHSVYFQLRVAIPGTLALAGYR